MDSTFQYIDQLRLYDKRKYARLYKKYDQSLRFFAWNLVFDRKEAEDIVSEVLATLWLKLNDFPEESSIKAFLYISTRNACVNFLMRERRIVKRKKAYRYLLDESSDYVLNDMIRAELLQKIWSLIEALPPKCRMIIILTYSEGLKYQEIADRLQISKHTVRNQVVRGIDIVKRKLEMEDL